MSLFTFDLTQDDTMLTDLPSHLDENTIVLFASPYHPDDVWDAQAQGGSEDSMVRAFQNAVTRDPEFIYYRRAVFGIAEKLDLNAWIIGDDLIIVEGDQEKLEQARRLLCEKYDCLIQPMADFIDHISADDFQDYLDIPAEKPPRFLN